MSVTMWSPRGRPPRLGRTGRRVVAVAVVVVVAAFLGVLSAVSGRVAAGVGVAVAAVPVLLALVQTVGGRDDDGAGGAAG